MKKFLIILLLIAAVILVFFFVNRKVAIAPGKATPTPSVSQSASPTANSNANITVISPKAGDRVGNPITVTGTARVFENTFAYALRDTNGNKLYENHAMTDAKDSGLFGNYTVKIPVPVDALNTLVVEVFEYSAKDGSVINLVRVPVTLASRETMKVKVYMTKQNTNDCSQVFPLEREVLKTQETAFIALTELLNGAATWETYNGYTTSIPKGVLINSIRITNSTAYADFDETLEGGVAGSCRVTAIRAEITETLKQFPTIKNVVISINGRTEGILQP